MLLIGAGEASGPVYMTLVVGRMIVWIGFIDPVIVLCIVSSGLTLTDGLVIGGVGCGVCLCCVGCMIILCILFIRLAFLFWL